MFGIGGNETTLKQMSMPQAVLQRPTQHIFAVKVLTHSLNADAQLVRSCPHIVIIMYDQI